MAEDAPHGTTRAAPTREEVAPRVDVLLEALPYIRQFAGATIVIKYGGAAMTTPELKASFARDVALLKLVGMNPVVVHGGGPDISRYSDRLGLEVRFVQGLRVTDAPTMELVKMVLVGKINKEIVAQLHVAGVTAVGLAGDDGGLILAEKASSPDGDLGFVGRVSGIDTRVLERLSDFVPVVASVGVDADGQSYNINADTVAGRLAAALGARRAIFLWREAHAARGRRGETVDVEGPRASPAAVRGRPATTASAEMRLYGRRMTFPKVSRASIARCASAARSSGSSRSITGLSFPSPAREISRSIVSRLTETGPTPWMRARFSITVQRLKDTIGLPTAPGVTSVPSRARASTLSANVSAPTGSKTTFASSSRTLGLP